MYAITFHCRTISPMFIGGAYSDEAELRPPSVKGALRFWARAIAKHWVFDDDQEENHQKLLKYDEELFGGIRMHQGKSLVSVEVRHGALRTIRGTSLFNAGTGLKYLLFTLVVHNTNTEKQGIEAGFPFYITFRSKNPDALQKAIAALWALAYLGGLGTRARRGAGAFEVISHEGSDLPLGISFNPGNKLTAFLSDGIKVLEELFDVPVTTQPPGGYSTLGKRIWIRKDSFRTWENALEEIGMLMYNLRQPKRPNPQYSDKAPRFTQHTLNQKAAFGLPVSVRNEDSNVVNFKKNDNENASNYDRRASPLWITLLQYSGRIHWVVTKLEGDFKEEQNSLYFKNRKGRVFPWTKEDDTVVTEFLKIVSRKADSVFNNM